MAKLNRNVAIRVAAALFLLVVVLGAVFIWPVVRFLYRERTLAEAVRKYSETPGVVRTADDDIRRYLVKLAQHHRLELSEGDVEIDYLSAPEDFGVPARIGYTLSASINFHGLKAVPLIAQRSFPIAKKTLTQTN